MEPVARESGSSLRILYVAEDPAGGARVRERLDRDPDVSVLDARDRETGLDAVAAGVHGVVVDHGGTVDGVAITEAVRERDPALPVVLVAPEDGRLVSRAVEAGASGYVPRSDPDAASLLVDRVWSAVDGRDDGRPSSGAGMPIEALGVREELRLKERAMDEAPVGITISDADRPDNPLIYVNDAFEGLTGYDETESIGRNCRYLQGEETDPEAVATMREAIDSAEPVSVELLNYRRDGDPFWNRVDVAPIRDPAGQVRNFVGFQTDVTARKRAEFAVERERRRLDHLLSRINGLLRNVHGDLVRALSRPAAETAVCEHIADTDGYAFCWIGGPDLSRNALVPTARAGAWEPNEGALEVEFADAPPDRLPVLRAYETGEVQVVDDPDEIARVAAAPWIPADGLAGLAAIPIVYRDTIYGVLTVYTTEEGGLNEREAVVLEAIARATATAINALERERIITADSVTELEFTVRDRDLFFVDISARYGADLEYAGSIYRDDGTAIMFFTTTVEPEEVEAAIADHPHVETTLVVTDHDDGTLYEFTVGEDSIVTALADRGARTRSISVSDGTAHLDVELAPTGDDRAVVAFLTERHPDTDLAAYRERERPPATKQEFIGTLKDRLTERQLTALQTAYVSGYYEWNRPVAGDQLAASMGITRTTYHQHLRAAERKLVAALFDG